MTSPIIGITVDHVVANNSETYSSNLKYSHAVARAGGVPILLPQEPQLADEFVRLCDGILLSGGADVRMETFGRKTHPQAKPMSPRRQEFDLALLAALDRRKQKPALGVCLGCQLMALHNGGDLDQHLPDTLGEPAAQSHIKNNRHPITLLENSKLETRDPKLEIVSSHHQAISNPGRLRIVATAPDGTVEAVDDPTRPFYLGVQWHPERGDDDPLSLGLIARFVAACRSEK